MSFQVGDQVYIIENNLRITQVMIISIRGEFYTVLFPDKKKAISVRTSRLFKTKETAEAILPKIEKDKETTPVHGIRKFGEYRSPYDRMNRHVYVK